MNDKLKSVIRVFINQGGEARLVDIYLGVLDDSPEIWSNYTDYQSVVRKTIYLHSSDTDIFQGEEGDYSDLFYSVDGKSKGSWGLRIYE